MVLQFLIFLGILEIVFLVLKLFLVIFVVAAKSDTGIHWKIINTIQSLCAVIALIALIAKFYF